MNSRCLYCDKRLSLFHGKKKPFCSDAHEDLFMERQALSGLDRLRDDQLEISPAAARTPVPVKPPLQFAYPEIEPGFFDDEPPGANRAHDNKAPDGIFNPPPQRSTNGIPPPADYLISSANAVQSAPPSLPFRDPAEAAFRALAWTRPVLLEGAPLPLAPDQASPPPVSLVVEPPNSEPLPPPLVTSLERLPMPLLTLANLPVNLDTSKVSSLPCDQLRRYSIPELESQPQAFQPEAPPLITYRVSPPIAAVHIAEPDAPRTFRDCPLNMALPEPVNQPRCHAPKFVAAQRASAPPADVAPQPGPIEYLPAPEPLRFRTMLDLRVAAFHTSAHRLFPAPPAPLTWNAAPPEALEWPFALQRRRPGPVLPSLEPVLTPSQERYL